jgi:hypothetical protein
MGHYKHKKDVFVLKTENIQLSIYSKGIYTFFVDEKLLDRDVKRRIVYSAYTYTCTCMLFTQRSLQQCCSSTYM